MPLAVPAPRLAFECEAIGDLHQAGRTGRGGTGLADQRQPLAERELPGPEPGVGAGGVRGGTSESLLRERSGRWNQSARGGISP